MLGGWISTRTGLRPVAIVAQIVERLLAR
jgi:hypothetical protein